MNHYFHYIQIGTFFTEQKFVQYLCHLCPHPGLDPMPAVPAEHSPSQGWSSRSRSGPGFFPGCEGSADLFFQLLLDLLELQPQAEGTWGRQWGQGREAVAGEGGGCWWRLVTWRPGGAALPSLRQLLPPTFLLAVLLVLLPRAGLANIDIYWQQQLIILLKGSVWKICLDLLMIFILAIA